MKKIKNKKKIKNSDKSNPNLFQILIIFLISSFALGAIFYILSGGINNLNDNPDERRRMFQEYNKKAPIQ
jgi:hypothetical protein